MICPHGRQCEDPPRLASCPAGVERCTCVDDIAQVINAPDGARLHVEVLSTYGWWLEHGDPAR